MPTDAAGRAGKPSDGAKTMARALSVASTGVSQLVTRTTYYGRNSEGVRGQTRGQTPGLTPNCFWARVEPVAYGTAGFDDWRM